MFTKRCACAVRWDFKSKNFDSVLLFKMGKFYEMFEMDTHVGVEVLGLTYMKGDQPHCGFPEVLYPGLLNGPKLWSQEVVLLLSVSGLRASMYQAW